MARQKKTTARRGRPPKNAAAPKRKYTRRAVRGTDTAIGPGFAGFLEKTQAQKDMDNRHAAIQVALEANRGGLRMNARALVREAQVFFDYIVNGESEPKAVEPDPAPDSVVGSGADTVFLHEDAPTLPTASTYNLRDEAAE